MPITHLLRVLLWVVPVTLFITLCNSITAIIWFPYYLVMSYWTLLVTPKFGPNLKFLLFLVAPVPALLFPAVTLVASLVVGLVLSMVGTWSPNPCTDNIFGEDVAKWARDIVGSFWCAQFPLYIRVTGMLSR